VRARLSLLFLALPLLVAAAGAARSPDDDLQVARKAVRAQRSVHFTDTSVYSVGSRWDYVADVGTTRGIKRLTFVLGGKTGHVTIVVYDGMAFVRGDALGLNKNADFREQPSKKYAGVWIRISRSDRWYQWAVRDGTIPSLARRFDLLPPFRERELTVGGQRVRRIFGRTVRDGDPASISLKATGASLPLEKHITAPDFKEIERFSRWNETLHVHAPAHSVPIAQTGLE